MSIKSSTYFESALGVAASLQLFVCVILAVAIPKATTVSLAILVCGSLFLVLIQGLARSIALRDLPMRWLWLMLLPLFVGVSGFWSGNQYAAAVAAISLAFVLLASGIVAGTTALIPVAVQRRCQGGFLVGVSLAVLIAALDFVGEQWLTRWVFSTWPNLHEAKTKHVIFQDGKAVAVSVATANRRAVALVCMVPAFIYCFSRLRFLSLNYAIALAGLSGFTILLIFTHSMTTQMAFGVGAIVFIGSIYLPRFTRTTMAIFWIAVWLVTVPFTIGLAEVRMQDSKWLPFSSVDRVKIWAAVAWDVLDKPIFGHGVGSIAFRDEKLDGNVSQVGELTPITHPHNGFLQIWHELGVVGALLFLAFGLWLLRLIDRLRDDLQPYFLGLFGICAAVTSTGFGIWQHWHLGAFALGVSLLWIVTQEERSNEEPRIQ